jgi:selenocysteine-specific elongation factor
VAHKVDRALALVRAAPYAPPSEHELGLTAEEAAMLVRDGRLTRVSDGLVFDSGAYHTMVRGIVEYIESHGKISIGEFRDAFGTTRKYTMALFDHLDTLQVTRRVGDDRVLGAIGRVERC